MIEDKIKEELTHIVGGKNVFTEKSQRLCYRFGNVTKYRLTPPDFLPDYVVRVKTSEQISHVLKLANKNKIPVVAWGGGTDFSGANSPIKGGIVIDIKELNQINVDPEENYVCAGAGAILLRISEEAEINGLLFPHEITSQPSATIGGAIATNSYGFRSGKYGPIRSLILGVEAVLPTGEIVKTKPLIKTSTGYDLASLLTGSEGTLGIITEATLRLVPAPETRKISSYLFSSFDVAYRAAKKIHKILTPDIFNLLELSFLSHVSLKAKMLNSILEEDLPNDFDFSAEKGEIPSILTIGFEGSTKVVNDKENIVCEVIGNTFALQNGDYYDRRFTRYHEDLKLIIEAFPGISLDTMTYADFDVSLPVRQVTEFNKSISKIADKIPDVYILDFDIYSTLSVIGLDLLIPNDNDVYHTLANEIYNEVLKRGGSISSVHGIGTRLLSRLEEDVGKEALNFMIKIKKALDPQDILNPGKIGDFNGNKDH